jgi:hypothetical protein
LIRDENGLYQSVTNRLEVHIRIHTIGPEKKRINKTKQQKDRKELLKIIIGRLDIMVNSYPKVGDVWPQDSQHVHSMDPVTETSIRKNRTGM